MLVFFTNSNHVEFQIGYLALFHLFSEIDSFGWFWMESFLKSIQFIVEFPRLHSGPPHFSYCTSVTFLMLLYVILLSMPMMLLSTLTVIKHRICATTRVGLKWLVDFSAGKARLVSFDWSSSSGAIDAEMDAQKERKIIFQEMGLSFSCKLDWGSYVVFIVKTASKKTRALICSVKFLSTEVAPCL